MIRCGYYYAIVPFVSTDPSSAEEETEEVVLDAADDFRLVIDEALVLPFKPIVVNPKY